MVNKISKAEPFFILGGIKCGTTFLYNNLKQHPNLCFSEPKEPTFFMLDQSYEQGIKYYYEKYYPHYSGEPVIGEARTHNFSLPWVPRRIHEMFPGAKLLAILRDPVKRSYSDYFHARRHAVEDRTFQNSIFHDYVRIKSGRRLMTRHERKTFQEYYQSGQKRFYDMYIDGGYYPEMISRYHNYFPPENLKLLNFSSLIESPLKTCNSVFSYLNLETLGSLNKVGKNTGSSPKIYWLQKIYRKLGKLTISDFVPTDLKNTLMNLNLQSKSSKKSMKALTKHWLADHYQNHNRRLSEFVNFSLDDWIKPDDVRKGVRLED